MSIVIYTNGSKSWTQSNKESTQKKTNNHNQITIQQKTAYTEQLQLNLYKLKHKSSYTIINAFNNRVKLHTDKVYISMKGKVTSVKVIPVSIGKN